MDFSYNVELKSGKNQRLLDQLMAWNQEDLLRQIVLVIKKEVNGENLRQELAISVSHPCISPSITGEHIKNFFVLILSGVPKILDFLSKKNHQLDYHTGEPFHEETLFFLEEKLDLIDFNQLFEQELNDLSAILSNAS